MRKGALDMIIFEELVYQEALRRKMTVSPERMKKSGARVPQTVRQRTGIHSSSADRSPWFAAIDAREDPPLTAH